MPKGQGQRPRANVSYAYAREERPSVSKVSTEWMCRIVPMAHQPAIEDNVEPGQREKLSNK